MYSVISVVNLECNGPRTTDTNFMNFLVMHFVHCVILSVLHFTACMADYSKGDRGAREKQCNKLPKK